MEHSVMEDENGGLSDIWGFGDSGSKGTWKYLIMFGTIGDI